MMSTLTISWQRTAKEPTGCVQIIIYLPSWTRFLNFVLEPTYGDNSAEFFFVSRRVWSLIGRSGEKVGQVWLARLASTVPCRHWSHYYRSRLNHLPPARTASPLACPPAYPPARPLARPYTQPPVRPPTRRPAHISSKQPNVASTGRTSCACNQYSRLLSACRCTKSVQLLSNQRTTMEERDRTWCDPMRVGPQWYFRIKT